MNKIPLIKNIGGFKIFIIIGFMTAAVAYLVNMFSVRIFKDKAVIYVVPLVEEGVKTLLPFYLGYNILINHVIFSLVEAIYDIINSKRRIALLAAMCSIISHFAFGIITIVLYYYLRKILLSMLGAYVVHSFWNYYINRLDKQISKEPR